MAGMEASVTERDYYRKQDELDRLLNDPDVQMRPDRIWALLDELAGAETRHGRTPAGYQGPGV